MRALSKSPDERYATAEEMARALVEALPAAPRSAVKAAVAAHGGEQARARERMRSGVTPTPGRLEPDARAILDVLTQQVHVARTEPPPPPPTKKHQAQTILGIALLVGIALLGVAATVMVVMKTYRPKQPVVAVSPPASTESIPPAPPLPTPSTTTADPVPVPSPIASPSVAVISPQTKPHGTKKTAPKATGEASTKPVSAPRPDCTPPYTVDAEGHRHYKAECVTPP